MRCNLLPYPRAPPTGGMAEYALGAGRIRKKKNEMKIVKLVATASRRRNDAVSPGNNVEDSKEKKNALRPNAESGRADAVPRCMGKFNKAR